MPLQDVTVSIDLVKPSGLIGLGKPLILAKKAGTSAYKTYSDIDSVKVDFAETTEAYKKAAAIFAQKNRPATLAIATYYPSDSSVQTSGTDVETTPTVGGTTTDIETNGVDLYSGETVVEAIIDAVSLYYDHDWFFLLTADADLTDQIAVADYLEGKKFKKFVVRTVDSESRNAFKVKDYEHTINFFHPVVGEKADAAFVGEVGSQEVGSVTWKFKTLKGITPIDITKDELMVIHQDGAIAYVSKAGVPQTSEGIVVSGEYIDVMHGKAWVKTNIENSIQSAFSTNKKIPFDHRGINLLDAQTTTVLKQAFSQGIIAADADENPIYTVNTLSREETPAEDRAKRVYNGLSFSFELAGAIHEANIKGEILV
ncbi:DUF3383 family protein [Priestia megaterium]|uniref:DUF3383 family protein n=1 Tax=Priestia megaterium TaxID=1404 RepID=UPI000BF740F3|nr:DUF3383 family protein [Priestia megaterium]PFJ03232.1 hypothetical protein COI84_02775 [Priestia megaterium]PGR11767.1 hypothetical protein COC62_14180 [Priestia megaterium]